MKNQINSYAQARISFYEASLQRKNTPQLVDEFNQLAQSRGWTAERSYFSTALVNEMLHRDIDISAIAIWHNEKGKIHSLLLAYSTARIMQGDNFMSGKSHQPYILLLLGLQASYLFKEVMFSV